MSSPILKLLKQEGWEIKKNDKGSLVVQVYGKDFPIVHPFAIYGKLYRTETNPEMKYQFMKKLHDYLWPQDIKTWNYWSEDRFRTYCEGYRIMVWAAGASTGKSVDAAKIVDIEWNANPKNTAVIVASTTIESLSSRVYGYVLRYLKEAKVPLNYTFKRSIPQKVLYDRDDEIHSISAMAAAKGRDQEAIANYIGRHPREKMVLILDEGPDLDPIILSALPNLEAGGVQLQCIVPGNSSSKFDLHGSLATPKAGWDSVDPTRDTKWETTQTNGICLYFDAYNSPAIHEIDPVKKARLAKFLPTKEGIELSKEKLGENSDLFWRQIRGFWKNDSTDDTIISRKFIDDYKVFQRAEWLGLHPLHVVGGLDPAFSTGGDKCILRLAILGQMTNGQIVLDYRENELLFEIEITAHSPKSAELQIADQVLEILKIQGCELHHLCIDANGQGRALGEVIALRANAIRRPIKIYSVRSGNTAVKSFDVVVKTPHELWFNFREFIQHGQIKGLDNTTIGQLTSRLVITKNNKQQLEPKIEYKIRMGAIMPSMAHSPDEADAASLCLQSAMLNFGFNPGQTRDGYQDKQFEHDKFWVHNQLKAVEENSVSRRQAPIADFSGNLSDIKSSLS